MNNAIRRFIQFIIFDKDIQMYMANMSEVTKIYLLPDLLPPVSAGAS